MNPILETIHPHKLIQTKIEGGTNRQAESIMSLGNGYMGARGNYEEHYSGPSLKGTYIAGVWVPDSTRVGWWKNGYPRYYGKVINAPDFLSVDLYVAGRRVDLNQVEIQELERVVDLFTGVMERRMRIQTQDGAVEIHSSRFFSIHRREIACVTYRVTALDAVGEVRLETGIDANVRNTDANYGEVFWETLEQEAGPRLYLKAVTKENRFGIERFQVALQAAVCSSDAQPESRSRDGAVSHRFAKDLQAGDSLEICKIVAVATSRDHEPQELRARGAQLLESAVQAGVRTLRDEQQAAWSKRWQQGDVVIEGDDDAQQGIRFNLFQLWSTYDGRDTRLNIGPKGFTGEKYGGAAYYDTEGYCFPMYLSTAEPQVARSLLLFRYNTLEKAKENAAKIGMEGALYPMVTFNGEECHNEWEITFEEIHRNAAMVHAIYLYTQYTGDTDYIRQYGIHVIVEVARFWASRSQYQAEKDCYMLLGVTPPNEYDNNVNNNWLTNYMARWCLHYALEQAEAWGYPLPEAERKAMRRIADKMYLPFDPERGIFLSQDGLLDKELRPADSIPPEERPLCKHWSWDRILRSCFIKQADVILAMYYFPNRFTDEEKRRNFEFYEPMTVHESSLSPSMYSLVASSYGNLEDGYRLYQRASRLDLDDINADTEDGLHITSMAGSWLAIVQGFAGMNCHGASLSFTPRCPRHWKRVGFRTLYRDRLLHISFSPSSFRCEVQEGRPLELMVNGSTYLVERVLELSLQGGES